MSEAQQSGESLGVIPDVVLTTTAGALFRSPLWFTWTGEDLRLCDEQGRKARLEAAVVALNAVPDGWAKVNGAWVQIAAMHTLFASDGSGAPTGYYARLDTEQYEASRG